MLSPLFIIVFASITRNDENGNKRSGGKFSLIPAVVKQIEEDNGGNNGPTCIF